MTFANDCANCCFFAQNWCSKKEKFCVSFRKKVLRMETLLGRFSCKFDVEYKRTNNYRRAKYINRVRTRKLWNRRTFRLKLWLQIDQWTWDTYLLCNQLDSRIAIHVVFLSTVFCTWNYFETWQSGLILFNDNSQ